VIFDCEGVQLLGIIHQTVAAARTGVLLIVGGPQYRVGSHRQFVLLARHLAAAGIPAMRFDVRGMGDSEGEPRNFAQIDTDIRTAIDIFFTHCPNLDQIVLWGLCDAASAALFYGYQDHRVKGLILLNPWVFTQQGAAKTHLKHYYLLRLQNPDFWKKLFTFNFDYMVSIRSIFNLLQQAGGPSAAKQATTSLTKIDDHLSLPIKMRECLKLFSYPVLLILSGRDLVAEEFKETVKGDPEWQSLLKDQRILRHDFSRADHTFSSADWRDQVSSWTLDWIKALK
jgi:exosortase A-associated hydrolase 1